MSSSKNRLGRGLGSLIAGGGAAPAKKTAEPVVAPPPVKAAPPSSSTPGLVGFLEIPIHAIEPGKYQPRRDFEPESLRELADSIRSEGLLQPIVVRQVGAKYQLIAGERRWRACQILGLKMIPARLVEAGDASAAVMALIENLQRQDLNAIEEALGYASLLRDFSLTQEAVAERVGKGRPTIANALRLLALDREIQGYLAKGLLSPGHAKILLALDDSAPRLLLARRAIEESWSVRELERQLRKLKAESKVKTPGRPTVEAEATVIRDLEKRLTTKLNTRVAVKHLGKHGRIIIEYFGNDDLHRILDRLGVGG